MADTDRIAAVRESLQRVWGYPAFLPLQEDAVRAVLDGRDSLVVLPTGGGKSTTVARLVQHRDGRAELVGGLGRSGHGIA